jgi:hypothetical protein
LPLFTSESLTTWNGSAEIKVTALDSTVKLLLDQRAAKKVTDETKKIADAKAVEEKRWLTFVTSHQRELDQFTAQVFATIANDEWTLDHDIVVGGTVTLPVYQYIASPRHGIISFVVIVFFESVWYFRHGICKARVEINECIIYGTRPIYD